MDVPHLQLFLICAAAVSCMGDKCWLQPKDICKNSTCDDVYIINKNVHLLFRYDQVCPKREGHAVALCYGGSNDELCYVMHIAKGQSCTNVDVEIIHSHNTIYTSDSSEYKNCIAVHEEANCHGRGASILSFRSGWSHTRLTSWTDKVKSVGLCSKDRKVHSYFVDTRGIQMGAAKQCYWLDAPNCGENSTCGDDHFMWIVSRNESCHGQPTKFCCPASNGHDVILCQDFDLKGKCIVTSISRGQTCANIDLTYDFWASSVHSLGGCIKAYTNYDCEGQMLMFRKNTDGFNVPLRLNDKFVSVGLCSPDEDTNADCNRASPEGRSKCAATQCYWLDAPNCGENSTCGDDHLMWVGSQNKTCPGQITKFCCPKSDGHDVVLCQHFNLYGKCIVTHIPRGLTCANIDYRYHVWASSVHSLEGCIKAYTNYDCKGEMLIFRKNTDGFNVPLRLNDEIRSVGLCSRDEDTNADCNRASPEGRSKCRPFTLPPPKLIFERKTEGRPVTHPLESAVPKN